MGDQVVKRDAIDPAVPDPHLFDSYDILTPSKKAFIDQLVASLTAQSRGSRLRLYTYRALRMAALTMATGVPIAVAASAPGLAIGLLEALPLSLRALSKCSAMRSVRSSRSDAITRNSASWKTSWCQRTTIEVPASHSSCSLTD
jgi:hypothetical protein